MSPNGAGKSTMVSMISTVLAPTSGTIKVDNKSLKEKPIEIKKIMGVVPQDLALYETLSAKDNLNFFGSLYGLKGKKLKERTDEVLEIIELTDKKIKMYQSFPGE